MPPIPGDTASGSDKINHIVCNDPGPEMRMSFVFILLHHLVSTGGSVRLAACQSYNRVPCTSSSTTLAGGGSIQCQWIMHCWQPLGTLGRLGDPGARVGRYYQILFHYFFTLRPRVASY